MDPGHCRREQAFVLARWNENGLSLYRTWLGAIVALGLLDNYLLCSSGLRSGASSASLNKGGSPKKLLAAAL